MPKTTKPRLFFIDNDASVFANRIPTIEQHDYEICTFLVETQEWLEEAIQAAKEFRPHIAMIDLRLLNDRRRSDISGLKLLKELKRKSPATQTIIYSAYLNPDIDREISRLNARWIQKNSHPRILLAELDQLASIASFSNSLNEITWPGRWKKRAILDKLGTELLPTSILDDVIHQLFPETVSKLYIQHIEGRVGVSPGPISMGRSLVASVQLNDRPVKKILKISTAKRIVQEKKNYDAYIKDNLLGVFHTQLESHTSFWDLGGSTYSFLAYGNEPLQSLLEFFRHSDDIETILTPIRHFFQEVWKYHYENSVPSDKSMYEEYKDRLGFQKKFDRFRLEALDLDNTISSKLVDPIQWILDNGQDAPNSSVRSAITHGDFHGDNLFTNGQHLWVIDFERTGPGHILRDFCELEIDLITRALDNREYNENNQGDFCRLAVELVGFEYSGEPSNIFSSGAKLLAFATGLRNTAQNVVRNFNQQEYYWGMLFDAVFVFLQRPVPENLTQQQRAWIVASLLCTRLSTSARNHVCLPDNIVKVFSQKNNRKENRSVYSMQIHRDDISNLIRTIDRQSDWRDKSALNRKIFLRTVGIPDSLVNNLTFDGSSSDTRQLVDSFSSLRSLVKEPNYTPLGLLFKSWLDDPVDFESSFFLAQCVLRYQLIRDTSYLTQLQTKYGIFYEADNRLGWDQSLPSIDWRGPATQDDLEKIWSERAKFLNAVYFFERGLAVAKATARIEDSKAEPIGTGFLVGPDLLLTNHHVIPHDVDLTQIRVRFGYRVDANGRLKSGEVYEIVEIVKSSNNAEIDYSLVRIAEEPGMNPEIGYLQPVDNDIMVDSALYIIQHPKGEPQKVVLQDNWVVYLAPDYRRVQYLTNTQGGSSGSPVCNEDWEVVALHHSREPIPKTAQNMHIQGNEGIPMRVILPEIQAFLPH